MNIDFSKYKDSYFEIAKQILAVPSPSGYCGEAMALIKQYAERFGAGFSMTHKGCGIISVKGRSHVMTLGLSAHCDTLGAMVRSMLPDGGLAFTKVGGPQLATLDGEYCTVITRDGNKYTGTFLSRHPSSHVYKDAATLARDEENMYVRLDETVKNADDVKALGIDRGDYICINPKTVVTDSGFIKSRFIDDKASVACFLTLLQIMKEEGLTPEYDLKMLVTCYEEVGHGAAYVPEDISSLVAVDMGCVGSDLGCTEHDVSICAKDSGGPYDYELTCRLIKLAKENGLDYSVDVYPYYGSDVGAMWRGGNDIPGALIGTGVHASHGMERTHFDGIKNTLALISLHLNLA